MVLSAWESMHAIHRQLTQRGFFSQFVGSMIQYRHPKKPELSMGLVVDEDPWRTAGKHGQFRFQLTNTTFGPDADMQEEAQALLNALSKEGLQLHGDFDVAEFKDAIAADAMHAMQAACHDGHGLHDAFKAYLKAIHDALKGDMEKTKNADGRKMNAAMETKIKQKQNAVAVSRKKK